MPAVAAAPWLVAAIAGGASAATGIYGANKTAGAAKSGAQLQSDAATKAAQLQTDAANHAADLQAKAAQDQLAFANQQAQLAQTNYLGTQQFNRQVYTDQQARLAPYRAFGAGAVAQLGQPIGTH